jgi:hypothetical protein
MHRRYALTFLAFAGLVAAILACNAPTPTPQAVPPAETTKATPTLPPQETPLPSPTATPPQAISTSTPEPAIETPSPAPTPTEEPTPTQPVSTGPLDFPVPGRLDHWRSLDDIEQEATIILHITGGAPPYTIYHDQVLVTATWKTDPAIVFQARGCGALVHTIIVESADGQSVQHKYWIPAPWCQ